MKKQENEFKITIVEQIKICHHRMNHTLRRAMLLCGDMNMHTLSIQEQTYNNIIQNLQQRKNDLDDLMDIMKTNIKRVQK